MPLCLLPRSPCSRRRALALGASVLFGGCARNAGSDGHPLGWYALLSDPHIAADASAGLRGEVMADNLRAAVAAILRADDPPHGVLVDGDLALHRGERGDYRTFLRLCEPLRRRGLPLHVTLGNHDDRTNLRAAIGAELREVEGLEADKLVATVAGPGLRFALLDSQDGVNVTSGRLGPEQIAWLARDLDAHPGTPTVIVVHHHLDPNARPALRDTAALLDMLRPRRQAKAVVFGHTHSWGVREDGGIVLINLPALGYRFGPREPLGWVVLRPEPEGAEIELRCVGGDRREDGRRIALRWRPA